MRILLSWLEGPRLLGLLLVGCGLASVLLGPDRGWDTRNYHLYVPWSLLVGRPQDVLPAGMQSFHNPTLDLPFALLVMGLNEQPHILAFLMGLPAGLALWLVWRLARAVLAETDGAQGETQWLALLALLGAAGGAILRSQVGTAAGDVTSGVLVLAALLAAATARGWRGAALAGLLCGLAIGLKLTNAPYAIALAAFLALVPGPAWRHRAVLLLACAAGGLAGVVLGYGWWGVALWAETGNPLFPYFHTRLVPGWEGSAIGRDARFLPAGALDLLTRPFRWAVSGTPIVTEERMRDPRVAAGLLAALALLATRQRALAAFYLTGFLVWGALFGIYRYVFVLEALAPLLVLAALAPLLRPARLRLPVLAALVAAAAVATIPIPSGRGLPAPRYLDAAWPVLAPEAVVLATSAPTAFMALSLPPGAALASIHGVGELDAEAFRVPVRALIGSGRPLYLIAPAGREGWEQLGQWGLEPVPESCRRSCTNWSAQGAGPMVCALRRPGEAPAAAPHWRMPARLCETAGLGLESAGRRGLALDGTASLDFGAGCREAEFRVLGPVPVSDPPAARGPGEVLRVTPAPDGLVRLRAAGPGTVITQARCSAAGP